MRLRLNSSKTNSTTLPTQASIDSTFVATTQTTYTSQVGQTYQNIKFTGIAAPVIQFNNCTNCTLRRFKVKSSTGIAASIQLSGCVGMIIELGFFDDVTSCVYMLNCTNCVVRYVWGTRIQTTLPRGQLVQFNGCRNCRVDDMRAYNPITHYWEDLLNAFNSSYITFNNVIARTEGLYNGSGTGGLIGDGDAVFISEYCVIENYTVVNVQQVGLAIAGGQFNKIKNAKIFGAQFVDANVGVYVSNQASAPVCQDNALENLYINYTNEFGAGNHKFIDNTPPNDALRTSEINVVSNAPGITADILPAGPFFVNETLFETMCIGRP